MCMGGWNTNEIPLQRPDPGTKSSGCGTWPKKSRRPPPWVNGVPGGCTWRLRFHLMQTLHKRDQSLRRRQLQFVTSVRTVVRFAWQDATSVPLLCGCSVLRGRRGRLLIPCNVGGTICLKVFIDLFVAVSDSCCKNGLVAAEAVRSSLEVVVLMVALILLLLDEWQGGHCGHNRCCLEGGAVVPSWVVYRIGKWKMTRIWINWLFGQAEAVWQFVAFPGYV